MLASAVGSARRRARCATPFDPRPRLTLPGPDMTPLLWQNAALHTSSPALTDACERFVRALGPVRQARLKSRLGVDLQQGRDLLCWFDEAFLRTLPAPEPNQVALLDLLERHLDAPSLRLAALVEQTCADQAWVVVEHGEVLVNVPALVAWQARLASPGSESAWLASQLPLPDAARVRCAWVLASDDELAAVPAPEGAARVIDAARMRRALTAQAPDTAAVSAAAARLRGALHELLQQDASRRNRAVDRLIDVPEPEGVLWFNARPLDLARPDAALIAAWLAPAEWMIEPVALVQGWAQRAVEDAVGAAAWLRTVPTRTAETALLLEIPAETWARAPEFSAEAWVEHLRATAPPTSASTRALLVDRPAEALGNLGWMALMQAAGRDDVEATLDALLAEDVDWADFDAPGEGSLPGFWMRVLHVRGELSEVWRERLLALDSSLEMPSADASVADVTAEFVSPAVAGESRHDLSESPMSSYAHGLHDSVAEAYGDVWSAADPFSLRRRS
jgi:hypothetical protein